jgi:PAS domain-containing protein
MTDRVDLFEAAIDSLPEGLALLHGDSDGPFEVMFWNQAAVAITGHTAVDLVGRALPDNLGPLLGEAPSHDETTPEAKPAKMNRSIQARQSSKIDSRT